MFNYRESWFFPSHYFSCLSCLVVVVVVSVFCFIHFISSHRIKFNSISSFICITVASHRKVLKGGCAKSQYIFVRISWNWFRFQVFYKMIDNMSVLYVGCIVEEAIILSFLSLSKETCFSNRTSRIKTISTFNFFQYLIRRTARVW